jgi:hypothetical protein
VLTSKHFSLGSLTLVNFCIFLIDLVTRFLNADGGANDSHFPCPGCQFELVLDAAYKMKNRLEALVAGVILAKKLQTPLFRSCVT